MELVRNKEGREENTHFLYGRGGPELCRNAGVQ